MSFWRQREESRAGELLMELNTVVPGTGRHLQIAAELKCLGYTVVHPLRQPPPPFVTVADCGHCFEDVGERA